MLQLPPALVVLTYVIASAVTLQVILALYFVLKPLFTRQEQYPTIGGPGQGIHVIGPDNRLHPTLMATQHVYDDLVEALTTDGRWDRIADQHSSRRENYDSTFGERTGIDLLLSGTYPKIRVRRARDGRITGYTYMWMLPDGNINHHVLHTCEGYE